MQHTSLQYEGAWTFGESQRTEWYILENKEIPGPGTHHEKMNKTNTSWTMGKSNKGASFIPKHTNAAIGTYNLNIDFTRPDSKAMSIGNSTRPELPESVTRDTNYKPTIRPTRDEAPHYSLGYFEERSYAKDVPGPESYDNGKPRASKSFNTRENYFTSADRPMPYGQQGKFPGVGKYHLQETKKDGPHYSIGTGERPPAEVCVDSPLKFYETKSSFGAEGKGFSLSDRLVYEANKDEFPAPNLYYPTQSVRKTKIFNCTSNRSNMITKEQARRPAPGDYNLSGSLDRGVGFANFKRPEDKPKQVPGPGTYKVEAPLNTIQGKMGWKLKKLAQDITPSAQDYKPNVSLTERRTNDALNLYSNRIDFSRSITKNIGPGEYQLRTQLKQELGKMGRSERPTIRSQTPGPGQYELPTTIGRIPKYYRSLNRKISEQGHTKFIKYDPNKTAEVRLVSQAEEVAPVKKQEPK